MTTLRLRAEDYVLRVRGAMANFVPVNTADNWLHLLLGAGMLVLGLVLGVRYRRQRG